ncbi:transposase, MuDR, MULE transposase domain protein, partial [Tanacetum coccineum]
MHNDLAYSLLHEMMRKKFNLETNDRFNLSVKLSSFDSRMDIIDADEKKPRDSHTYQNKRRRSFRDVIHERGASIRTFVNYLRPLLIIGAAHLKGEYKGTNLLAVRMDGNNQIVPIAFGICKRETGPCWSWWMSVLKEYIGDNPNLLFISDRHPAIALALPVTKLAETYRAMLQDWYFKRQEVT